MSNEDILRSIGNAPDQPGLRDAVHIAVISVIVGYPVKPGQRVGIFETSPSGTVMVGPAQETYRPEVGIIDPFRPEEQIEHGQAAWLFLFPGSITSLQHEWAHPKFPSIGTQPASGSEAYLREFAEDIGISYRMLMDMVPDYTGDGYASGDWHIFSYDTPKRCAELNDPDSAFWRHYEAVTGTKVTGHRNFFSCSC